MTVTQDEIRATELLRDDPIVFAEDVLGCGLWSMQREILLSVRDNPRTTVRSCSAAGKTYTAANAAMHFLYTNPPATVVTTAPTWTQVEDILWAEIRKRYNNANCPLGGRLLKTKLDLTDITGETWMAIGLSTDETERMLGFHNDNVLVIVDESSGVEEKIFEAIENPLSSGHTRLLLIGNPTNPTGTFHKSFKSPIYKTFHISAFDTPNFTEFGITMEDIRSGEWQAKIEGHKMPYPGLINPQFVADRYEDWGEGSYMFKVWVMGDFPEAGVNNLFTIHGVEAAIARANTAGEGDPVVAALDVSRYGDSETVYCCRKGNKVLRFVAWSHQDGNYTAGRCKRLMEEDKPVIIRIDASGGWGGTVIDAFKTHGITNYEEYMGGADALDKERFANRRAEDYWRLYKLTNDDLLDIPDDPKLKSQLLDIRYTYRANGQILMESKEDMRKRGSKSPDYADALVMASRPASAGVEGGIRVVKVRQR